MKRLTDKKSLGGGDKKNVVKIPPYFCTGGFAQSYWMHHRHHHRWIHLVAGSVAHSSFALCEESSRLPSQVCTLFFSTLEFKQPLVSPPQWNWIGKVELKTKVE